MLAHEYPISLGFKAVYMPYYGEGGTFYPGHHGIDWACPEGTEIRIGNRVVGWSGSTGAVTGAHLHVDRSIDGSRQYESYRSPRYFYKINGAVTYVGYAGTAGNMIIIKADDGDTYRLLHLSKFNVKVGDRIGSTMAVKTPTARVIYSEVKGYPLGKTHKGEFDDIINREAAGKTWQQYVQESWSSKQASQYRAEKVRNEKYYAKKAEHDQWKQDAINANAEVDRLKAELALCGKDTENLNKLGEALKWFIERLGLRS